MDEKGGITHWTRGPLYPEGVLGADDYVTKPFSKAELISRVRVILRWRKLDWLRSDTQCAFNRKQSISMRGLDT